MQILDQHGIQVARKKHDAAGIVDSVGEGVVGFAPGDRVYLGGTLTGAYAEQTLAEAWQVHPLPPNVTFAQGAGVNVPYATAFRALFQIAHAQPAETVLIHGASGGVGVAGVQLARAGGMTVIGTGGTERGRKLVVAEGAHHVLDHHAPDYLDELMKLTGGRGVDVVLEMLANVNLAKDLSGLASHGRVVVIGNRGNIEINPREIMRRTAAVLGMVLWNASRPELASIHAGIVAGLLYAFAMIRRGRIGEAVAAHATTNVLLAAYVLLYSQWHLW